MPLEQFTIAGRESLNDIRGAVDDWRHRQGQHESVQIPKQTPDLAQDFIYPIRCYTLQDISHGEWGLAMQLVRAHSANSFKIDLHGLWNMTSINFQLELEVNGTVHFLTSTISGNGTTTAEDMENAIVATGALLPEEVNVELGNPYVSNNLLQSSHTDGKVPTETITGSWHVTFHSFPTEILELRAINVGGQVISDSSLVVSRRTYEQPNGQQHYIFDALDLSLPAPIRAGSKVICLPFAEGFGITAAMQTDFYVEQGT